MKVIRSTTRSLVAILSIFSLAGCEQPMQQPTATTLPQFGETAEPVMIETDAASYALGARISIRLTNRTGRPAQWNVCTSTLETFGDDNSWRAVTESLADDCNSGPRTLAPGQSMVAAFTTRHSLPAGRYRIRARLTDSSGVPRVEVRSNMFTLISGESSG